MGAAEVSADAVGDLLGAARVAGRPSTSTSRQPRPRPLASASDGAAALAQWKSSLLSRWIAWTGMVAAILSMLAVFSLASRKKREIVKLGLQINDYDWGNADSLALTLGEIVHV